MARSDLLVRLVEAGIKNDNISFRKIANALIAEEQSCQHVVLAQKLRRALENNINTFCRQPPGCTNVGEKPEGLFYEVIPKKTIEDLILPAPVVRICRDLIEEHGRSDLLRSYNLEPRNKMLLIGPPGNGKTSLAEALAEALMVPLYVVRYEAIIGTYLGETAVRLKHLFEYASSRRCVLFFDEFETLGKERGDAHETGEIKRVVSSLLLQIDNLPSHVMVIGATNHAELLDRAVWRRFQIRMALPAPTQARLIEWFDRFERRIGVQLGYAPTSLAKRFYGANFAEVEEFGANIYRQYVLGMPVSNMRRIVARAIKNWSTESAYVKS